MRGFGLCIHSIGWWMGVEEGREWKLVEVQSRLRCDIVAMRQKVRRQYREEEQRGLTTELGTAP